MLSERLREPGRAGRRVVQPDGGRWRSDGVPAFVRHGVVPLCRQRLERIVHQLFRAWAFTVSNLAVSIGFLDTLLSVRDKQVVSFPKLSRAYIYMLCLVAGRPDVSHKTAMGAIEKVIAYMHMQGWYTARRGGKSHHHGAVCLQIDCGQIANSSASTLTYRRTTSNFTTPLTTALNTAVLPAKVRARALIDRISDSRNVCLCSFRFNISEKWKSV